MDILYLMIVCSVSLAAVFLILFIVNAKKGQFEDDESPAVRILFDDEIKNPEATENTDKQQNTNQDKKSNEQYGNTKV